MIRNEIGSEFCNIPISDKKNGMFCKDTKWFISGTAALRYIIADILSSKQVKKASLPSWCCGCMIEPFVSAGMEVEFYPVTVNEKQLIVDVSQISGEVVLVMDYFGYLGQVTVPAGFDGIVIRDITHSVFSATYFDADYYFGSLRKWAGFWTGGFAFSVFFDSDCEIMRVDNSYVSMRKEAMKLKREYLNGTHNSKSYLLEFEKCEEFLDSCDIMGADENDINSAEYLNVSFIKNLRKKNARILLSELGNIAIFPEPNNECPLFVPIIVDNGCRNELRRFLISNDIYCPVHWPLTDEHEGISDEARSIYNQELSLICDQRYDDKDMQKIIETIKDFFA